MEAEAGKLMGMLMAKAEAGQLMVAKAKWGMQMVEAEAGKLMRRPRDIAVSW